MTPSCLPKLRLSQQRFLAILAAPVLVAPGFAHAWGDEGHEIVAQIADHYPKP